MDEPFYNELRTDQQLGYVVGCFEQSYRDLILNNFLVQGDKHAAEYVVARINEFLTQKREQVKVLTDEEFET